MIPKCRECQNPPSTNQSRCAICLSRNRARHAARVSKRKACGLCRCGKPQAAGRPSCQSCLSKNLVAQRLRRNRVKNGLVCGSCGSLPVDGKRLCQQCLELARINGVARNRRARNLVLDHYGRQCAICVETIDAFLTIDHVNNDGAQHRKECTHGIGGNVLYRWLVRNDFPEGFQTLCYNCNCSKTRFGHKRSHTRRTTDGIPIKCVECGRQSVPWLKRCRRCLDYWNERSKAQQRRWRRIVMEHYGPKCACCGNHNDSMLTIDHINGDGCQQRKNVKGCRYHWIVRNGFPKDLRILCYNCNCGRQMNGGTCPHTLT